VSALGDARFRGILNGFEYPPGEPDDAAFDAAMAEKSGARAAIAAEFTSPGDFLLGFVGRAVEQKLGLLAEPLAGRPVLEHLLDIPGVNLALVATGEPEYEEFLRSIPAERGGVRNFSAVLEFAIEKARLISRGCDVFLMPSLFEPCGITQLESMARGTPPLVRRTGGLADTVTPHDQPDGTGFVFDGPTRDAVLEALVASVREAVALWHDRPADFRCLQRNAFRRRYTWDTAARRYTEEVYTPALEIAGKRRT
jgi:starch synthase